MAFPGEGGGARRGKRRRLSRSAEFDRVFREGRSHASRYLVLHAFPRPDAGEEEPRLGVSVGRKVGGAVERNRVRRRLREMVRLTAALPEQAGHDYVLIGRRAALNAPFDRMVADFAGALKRIHKRRA